MPFRPALVLATVIVVVVVVVVVISVMVMVLILVLVLVALVVVRSRRGRRCGLGRGEVCKLRGPSAISVLLRGTPNVVSVLRKVQQRSLAHTSKSKSK
jgi:hypothetical protein